MLEETHGERIIISVIVMLAGPKAVEVVNVRDAWERKFETGRTLF